MGILLVELLLPCVLFLSLQFMEEMPVNDNMDILYYLGIRDNHLASVTFGAPFIGNKAIQEFMTKHDLHNYFFNFVHEDDPVPRLLNLVETATSVASGATSYAKEAVREILKLNLS